MFFFTFVCTFKAAELLQDTPLQTEGMWNNMHTHAKLLTLTQ